MGAVVVGGQHWVGEASNTKTLCCKGEYPGAMTTIQLAAPAQFEAVEKH